MGTTAVEALLAEQEGVVSRRQVHECRLDDCFIEAMVRRREWARVHPGVYVSHTGPPSFLQRAWATVLFYWPAALCHESAVLAHGGRVSRSRAGSTRPSSEPVVHVAVDQGRRVSRQPGVRVHRVRGLDRFVAPARRPPRLRLEHAVLQVASSAGSDDEAVAVLADACQSWATNADRLAAALRDRPRLPRRAWLRLVLEDVAAGAYSALERRYLRDVERRHGLPTAARQRVVTTGRTSAYRDVDYVLLGLVVELDGRLGHEEASDRWRDLDRDVDAAVDGRVTVRVTWGQVLQPCRLAAAVGTLLTTRGWSGRARPCGPGCLVDRGGSPAPRAEESPRSA